MKNVKICCAIFLAVLGWSFISNVYLTNLQNKLGYYNDSTGVMNFSHESSVMISKYEQIVALISMIFLIALFIFARRAFRENKKIVGGLFILIATAGIVLCGITVLLAPLNTMQLG